MNPNAAEVVNSFLGEHLEDRGLPKEAGRDSLILLCDLLNHINEDSEIQDAWFELHGNGKDVSLLFKVFDLTFYKGNTDLFFSRIKCADAVKFRGGEDGETMTVEFVVKGVW